MRILLVEDNKDTATSMAEFLKLLGHEVHIANSEIEAKNLVSVIEFDEAIIDWWLFPDGKGGAGNRIIAWLRSQGYRQPIALVTGSTVKSIQELSESLADVEKLIVVQKPIEVDKIIDKLAKLRG